jgi:hypothetical protein
VSRFNTTKAIIAKLASPHLVRHPPAPMFHFANDSFEDVSDSSIRMGILANPLPNPLLRFAKKLSKADNRPGGIAVPFLKKG